MGGVIGGVRMAPSVSAIRRPLGGVGAELISGASPGAAVAGGLAAMPSAAELNGKGGAENELNNAVGAGALPALTAMGGVSGAVSVDRLLIRNEEAATQHY